MDPTTLYTARRRSKWTPGKQPGQEWFVQATLGVSATSGRVARLADQSGKARDAIQNLTGRMLWQSYLHRRPALFADGTDDGLATASFTVAQPWAYTALICPTRLLNAQTIAHRATSGDVLTSPLYLQGPQATPATGDRAVVFVAGGGLRGTQQLIARRYCLIETYANGANSHVRTRMRTGGTQLTTGPLAASGPIGGLSFGGDVIGGSTYYQGFLVGGSLLSGSSAVERDRVWSHFESLTPWSLPAPSWSLDAHPGYVTMGATGAAGGWATAGQSVNAWLNYGETAGAATSTADIYRPSYDTGIPRFGARSAVRFNTSQFLACDAALYAAGSTTVLVFANTSASNATGRYLLAHVASGMGLTSRFAASGNADLSYFDGAAHHVIAPTGTLGTALHVLIVRQVDGGELTIWLDGVEKVRKAAPSAWAGRKWDVLGAARFDGTAGWIGEVAAWHQFDAALSDSVALTVGGECRTEWGTV